MFYFHSGYWDSKSFNNCPLLSTCPLILIKWPVSSEKKFFSPSWSLNSELKILKLSNYFLLLKKPSLSLTVAGAAAKLLQSCPTLCDPTDGSPPGSAAPGILQARTLEWVAISFSNAWKWKVKVKSLSRVRLFATPWTAAHQAPLSMGFFQARALEWGAIAFSVPPTR